MLVQFGPDPQAHPAKLPSITLERVSDQAKRDHGERAHEDLGGETACWAHLVCVACGAMTDDTETQNCPTCGAELPE